MRGVEDGKTAKFLSMTGSQKVPAHMAPVKSSEGQFHDNGITLRFIFFTLTSTPDKHDWCKNVCTRTAFNNFHTTFYKMHLQEDECRYKVW
jgi:hypothetical protein